MRAQIACWTRRLLHAGTALVACLILASPRGAYAQALASASGTLSFSNATVSPASGTLQLQGPWTLSLFAQAQNSLGELSATFQSGASPGSLSADAMVTYATAHGDASAPNDPPDFNLSGHTAGQINLLIPCAEAITTGLAMLSNSFVLTGGTGTTDVTFSADIAADLNVMTGPYGLLAQTESTFTVELDGTPVLFRDDILSIGPNDAQSLAFSQTLTATVPVTMGVSHTLVYSLDPETHVDTTMPEASSIVLMLPGLGVLAAGYAWKRRIGLRACV